MGTLERYLGAHFLRSYLLVLLVLLALFGFLDFVDELSEVGQGDYRLGDALLYVLATFPTKLLEFAAICTLMGGSLALAALARGSEILAMRAAGMAPMQIALALMKVILALVVVLGLVAEFIAPHSQQWGFLHRQHALAGSDTLRTGQGFWSRDRRQFLNVRDIPLGRVPQQIDLYRFDGEGRLLEFIHARQAEVQEQGDWRLEDVVVKRWRGGILQSERLSGLRWHSFLTARELQVLRLPPQTLAVSDLWRYVRYLKSTGQKAEQYDLLFWQRVMIPVQMVVMLLFLLPVVVISPRSGGVGWPVAAAVAVGVMYFLATQVVANLGLLLNVSPLLTALTPTVVVLLLALALLERYRY